MIDKCPSCGSPVRAWYYGGGTVLGNPKYERAAYCKNCVKPYPWTQAALESTAILLQEDTELDEILRNNLVSSLPDIISETPKTQIAIVRFKKAALSVGKFTADALRQFAIDFGCELAKKELGL